MPVKRQVRAGWHRNGWNWHARELRFVQNAELVAAASRREDQVKQFAHDHEVKRWYTDYHELLADKDVDVVCVLAPTGQHAELAIDASGAGKHVLVEKPLEADLAKADRMIQICRRNRPKLGVIFQMRFGLVATKIKKAIDAGALGRIFLADTVDKSSRTSAYYESDEWRGTKSLEGSERAGL